MVAYGKKLKNARRPGWEKAYLEYDVLKDLLEQDIRDSVTMTFQNMEDITAAASRTTAQRQQEACARFLAALEQEIEKVSLFTLTRQGELAEAIGAYRFPDFQIQLLASTSTSTSTTSDLAPVPPPPPIQQSDETTELLFGSPILKRSGEKVAALPAFTRRSSLTRSSQNGIVLRPMFRVPESLRSLETTPSSSATLTSIAIELLHLLRFICVNAVGIRKILKKYDKLWLETMDDDSIDDDNNTNSNAGRETVLKYADHIQQLANAASIYAVHASLDSALKTILAAEAAAATSTLTQPSVSTIRLQCAMEAIQVLREYAVIVNQPFTDFLSRRAMIVTGRDREERKALLAVLWFNPDTLAQTPDAELLAWWWKRSAAIPLDRRRHHRRLSTTVISMDDVVMDLVERDFVVDHADSWGGVSTASMAINLASTLLYTVNYYIIAPTANHYASNLGTDGAYGSTLIGASSFAAIFAAFLYSFWYTKSSFRSALLFSSVCPLFGNFLYMIAISYKSMNMALAGRVLCGFGSAEVVNRQLISACVSFSNMTRASALFVASSALGMGVGPLMAGILENVFGTDMQVDIPTDFLPGGGMIINDITSPALVMSILWFLELLAICFFFEEPDRVNASSGHGNGDKGTFNASSNGKGLHDHTGKSTNYGSTSSLNERDKGGDEENNWLLKSDDGTTHKKPGNTFRDQIIAIYQLIFANAALPVTLYIFAFIELVDEVLISSCSMVVHRYFGWKGSVAGFLIASLGSLVLPADFFVERMSHIHSERKIMKSSLIFLIICMVFILNFEGLVLDIVGEVEGENAAFDGSQVRSYLNKRGEFYYDWNLGRYVYVFFLSAIFMGTIVLEGVDTSMMSRVTPPSLNDTFINCGLLATLIGTFGRVAGDSMITISALVDKNIFTDFVNATFFPLIPLALFGFFLVSRYYKQFV